MHGSFQGNPGRHTHLRRGACWPSPACLLSPFHVPLGRFSPCPHHTCIAAAKTCQLSCQCCVGAPTGGLQSHSTTSSGRRRRSSSLSSPQSTVPQATRQQQQQATQQQQHAGPLQVRASHGRSRAGAGAPVPLRLRPAQRACPTRWRLWWCCSNRAAPDRHGAPAQHAIMLIACLPNSK